MKSGSNYVHETESVYTKNFRKNDGKVSNPDFVISQLKHAGKPIVIDAKNYETFIDIKEVEKLHNDCIVRKAAGGILAIKNGAALRDNAKEYAEKHNIIIIEVDENHPTASRNAIEKAITYF